MENAALHELNVHSYPNNIAKATLELAGEISKDDALQKQSPTSHYEKWVWGYLKWSNYLKRQELDPKHHRRLQLAEMSIKWRH